VNNVDTFAENRATVLLKVAEKAKQIDAKILGQAVIAYGNARTQKIFDNGGWLST
jgi:hypothetical protein